LIKTITLIMTLEKSNTVFNILKSHQSDIPIRIEFLLHSLSIYSSLSDSLFHVFRAVDNQSD